MSTTESLALPAMLVVRVQVREPTVHVQPPVVVRYAPQRELLSKSYLTITHAGLNSTLESDASQDATCSFHHSISAKTR